jgi:hypothetical protein
MRQIPLATAALVTGILLLAGAVVAWRVDADGFVIGWLGFVGVLAIAGTIFERVRYKDVTATPPRGPGWIETSEKFRDPATQRWVQVYFKPQTGERSYVDIPPPPTN